MEVLTEPLNERQKQVIALREQGLTHAQIARAMKVTRTRAVAMEKEARERLKDFAEHGKDALCLLPGMVVSYLKNKLGCMSGAEVRAAIEAGEMVWDEKEGCIRYGGKIPWGGGRGIWQVLCAWAGLPPPFPERVVICPHCGGKVPL